jgi:hypothetical protein
MPSHILNSTDIAGSVICLVKDDPQWSVTARRILFTSPAIRIVPSTPASSSSATYEFVASRDPKRRVCASTPAPFRLLHGALARADADVVVNAMSDDRDDRPIIEDVTDATETDDIAPKAKKQKVDNDQAQAALCPSAAMPSLPDLPALQDISGAITPASGNGLDMLDVPSVVTTAATVASSSDTGRPDTSMDTQCAPSQPLTYANAPNDTLENYPQLDKAATPVSAASGEQLDGIANTNSLSLSLPLSSLSASTAPTTSPRPPLAHHSHQEPKQQPWQHPWLQTQNQHQLRVRFQNCRQLHTLTLLSRRTRIAAILYRAMRTGK